MEKEKAIEYLNDVRNGIHIPAPGIELPLLNDKEKEAIDLAIAALEKQEQDRWRPFRCRKTTEDDCSSFDYIMDCELPKDGQEILITVNNNRHEPVQMDTFFGGGGEECALDSGYDLCDEAIAWRPLPEPYQEDEA